MGQKETRAVTLVQRGDKSERNGMLRKDIFIQRRMVSNPDKRSEIQEGKGAEGEVVRSR